MAARANATMTVPIKSFPFQKTRRRLSASGYEKLNLCGELVGFLIRTDQHINHEAQDGKSRNQADDVGSACKEVAKLVDTLEGDEKTGGKVILKALEAPLFHIAANAGLEGAVIINKVRESEVGVGFDAYNEQYVNMVDAGILDPAKVTRTALQNATSVASTFLTTEACVANIKEETPAAPAGGGMGMM